MKPIFTTSAKAELRIQYTNPSASLVHDDSGNDLRGMGTLSDMCPRRVWCGGSHRGAPRICDHRDSVQHITSVRASVKRHAIKTACWSLQQ